MARKQLERLLSEAAELADRLGETDDTLSSREVNELLALAEQDQEALRLRLHSSLKELAIQLRRSGQLVPPYLSRVIDSVSGIEVLAAKRPELARARMREALRALVDSAARTVSLPAGSFEVAHAYRKTGDLSPEDSKLLDVIETELKSRLAEPSKGPDSE